MAKKKQTYFNEESPYHPANRGSRRSAADQLAVEVQEARPREDEKKSKEPFWIPPKPGDRPMTVRRNVEFQKVVNGPNEIITYESPQFWDGGPFPKYSYSEVAAAARMSKGVKAEAARILRVHYNTIANYVRKWPELEDVFAQAREHTLDKAELKLQEHIELGSLQALMFYLSTQGRERGYTKTRTTVNVDLSKLSDAQLERLSRGEPIDRVLTNG